MSLSDDLMDEQRDLLPRRLRAPHRKGSSTGSKSRILVPGSEQVRECYIVIGNHISYHGIGEILYTLYVYFSTHYKTYISDSIVPNQINVIIDEFSNTNMAEYLQQCKDRNPGTRFILMATEFITPMLLLGRDFGKTFNVFDIFESSRDLVHLMAHRLRLKQRPPYMYARYHGFIQALRFADLVLCAHPAVSASMAMVSEYMTTLSAVPMTLYPEVVGEHLKHDRRLHRLPAGFVLSGTLTPYRRRVVAMLVLRFLQAGIHRPVYHRATFEESPGLRFIDDEIDFGYDELPGAIQTPGDTPLPPRNYVYNLNPPQRSNWRYSSPMRILRAVLLGQIPVVTRKFADHDIESVALTWDSTVATAERMWVDATVGRQELVARHLAAVIAYNQVARENNAPIDRALAQLE